MGEATARRFAVDGMTVGVMDIDFEAAGRVAAAINSTGGRALALAADVAESEQVAAAVARLRSECGQITVLVNNAAVDDFCPFATITQENWDRIMDINLKGVMLVSQAVLPDMMSCGWGRIVNIASYGAQLSIPNMAHYCASKGGLISLTRALAAELGQHGITVNTVSPGFIDTPMSRHAIEAGKFPVAPEVIFSAYPIPRMGRAEEIAAACAFFVSDEASYITAQLLGVNGGAAV